MAIYKDKQCIICSEVFTPTSPKHKTCCKTCASEMRRRTERVRDARSRKKYSRVCLACKKDFITTDSRRKYCGAPLCEDARVRKNALVAEANRPSRQDYRIQRYSEKKVQILEAQKKGYRIRQARKGLPVKDGHSTTPKTIEDVREFSESVGYTLLSDVYVNNREVLSFECPEGHLWKSSFHNFKDSSNRCLQCYSENRYDSRPEKELLEFVNSLLHGNTQVVHGDRSLISPLELDIFIPAKKLAIEYCGLYWHSELASGKSKDYHYMKMERCRQEGVRLITIFEDEFLNSPGVVKSRIANALSAPSRRMYARKCTFSPLYKEQTKSFLAKCHLQGASGHKYSFGLSFEGELVMLMTFGALSRTHALVNGKPTLELKRFASLPFDSVVGGASKLLKHSLIAIKQCEQFAYLKSYCDMRYANIFKPVYETLGFEMVSFTKYTPHYVKGQKRFRNQGLRKTPEERLTGKTEWELRQEQGYDRIWDCGHRTYVLTV